MHHQGSLPLTRHLDVYLCVNWHTKTQWEWVSNVPVLRYHSLEDEVTLQWDASQSGLGAALIQLGQPVAFTSHALMSAETRYAQIE